MRETQYEATQATYDSPKTNSRDTPTQEQTALLEKTLHHLAGRVVELKARMERALLPRQPEGDSAGEASPPERQRSPHADELYIMRGIANGAIREVEDILNRLDV